MSLQSIMDATEGLYWSEWRFGEYVATGYETTYLIAKAASKYELWWRLPFWEESKKMRSDTAQEIIDKINELEGIK